MFIIHIDMIMMIDHIFLREGHLLVDYMVTCSVRIRSR